MTAILLRPWCPNPLRWGPLHQGPQVLLAIGQTDTPDKSATATDCKVTSYNLVNPLKGLSIES